MLKKIISYFYPITIYNTKSKINKSIEINWENGELVMNTENTNYSYGSLQRILKIGLKKIGYSTVQSMNNILVLGVAGGSVIKTLIDEIEYKGMITGVDIDPEIISIANSYFQLHKVPNLTIEIQDAFEYVLKSRKTFDLIIIDIFQDTKMPIFLFNSHFIAQCLHLLESKGFILFNTMILNEDENLRNQKFIKDCKKMDFNILTIPRIEKHNELILIRK